MLGAMTDATLWMPSGMDEYARAEYADLHPDDPHMAAAVAWEDWAAQQDDPDPDGGAVVSVSTGVQSVTYSAAPSARSSALSRAAWHRARARVHTEPVGPQYAMGWYPGQESTGTADDSGDESFWSERMP